MTQVSSEIEAASPQPEWLTARPRLVVSRCLGFASCRWNGDCAYDPFVDQLRHSVDIETVCPECDIGLGVPRRPVRLIQVAHEASEAGAGDTDGDSSKEVRLIQPATGADVTEMMQRWAHQFIEHLEPVDGFLLKFRSPSCGPGNVKIYRSADQPHTVGKGSGLFARIVEQHFEMLPIEDEGRLRNFKIREHWLMRIFALARLRAMVATARMKDLVDFHARHKYLLMMLSQSELKRLGRVVAAGTRHVADRTIAEYAILFRAAISGPPRYTTQINVLQHLLGHFSDRITGSERHYFLDLIEEFRRGAMPLSVPVQVIKSWAIRFDDRYVYDQVFLSPYPESLVKISDSGKGRDF